MPSVLLVGDFGPGDPGQESLLRAAVRELPDVAVTATSTDPSATRSTHPCEAIRVTNRPHVLRVAAASDAVVFAGGRVFSAARRAAEAGHGLGAAAALSIVSAASGGLRVLLGVGVVPLAGRAAPLVARRLARKADLLILRDRQSAAALAESGLPTPFWVGTDPVWAELENGSPAHDRDEALVTVAVAGEESATGLADFLVAALRPVLATGHRVQLLPWRARQRTPVDLALARRIAARLQAGVEVLDPPHDLKVARAVFTESGVVVGLHRHAISAAASAGARLVAVYGHERAPSHDAGLHVSSINLRCDPQQLSRAIADGGPSPSAASVAREHALAGESFRLLRLLLDRGRSEDVAAGGGLDLAPVPWPR